MYFNKFINMVYVNLKQLSIIIILCQLQEYPLILAETETALTDEDFANLLESAVSDAITDPKAAGKFEGDIDLNQNPLDAYLDHDIKGAKAAIRNAYYLWPDAIIFYTVSSQLTISERRVVAAAITHIEAYTCIRFKPRTTQRDYIYIYKAAYSSCYSMIGKVAGRQTLGLGGGCYTKGIVVHELMHAIGFFHEQSRADRDKYIDVLYRNIMTRERRQFKKYSLKVISHLGISYDYGSIMHYGPYAFSKNSRKTIVRRQPGPAIGQRSGLSSKDKLRVNKLYCTDKPKLWIGCKGRICGCHKGYCWAYVDEWKINKGDWWCYTQKHGIMEKEQNWATCSRDADCQWCQTCGSCNSHKGNGVESATNLC